MKYLYLISTNNGADFIKKTGFGNTWAYSDKKNATRFQTRSEATEYASKMPKNLELKIEKE